MWEKSTLLCLFIICQVIFVVISDDVERSQNNEILYKINWPGKIESEIPETADQFEEYPITTANKENYTCRIRSVKKQVKESDQPYTGPNPIELLSPMFNQKLCSFKLDTYWTYEICHGRYVRQYHEEREEKKVNVLEFYLGTFTKAERAKLSAEYDERAKNPDKTYSVPTKKFDGVQMPYVEIQMTDGTQCDLSNKPRTIRLLYVCHQHGKHEIYSLEETASCEYEAIILTPLICSHPDYDPRGSDEDEINCVPVGKSPRRPRALAALEAESLKLRHQKVMQDGEPQLQIELYEVNQLEKSGEENSNSLSGISAIQPDVSPVKSFLSGKHCLHGGDGWWKYEFCYGRSVVQYHVEKNGKKITIDLGKFDKKKHLDWIKAHPDKRPKLQRERKYITHFYSDGSFCDETGKARQTEVRLKCVDVSGSPSSVSLFLLEPKTCEYILGVESPLICNILEHADENGLINDSNIVDYDSLKTTTSAPKKEESSTSKKDPSEL
ncbi:endoplasmic reticulum lectin 1 isoform X2 [Chelonus insularis]|uniref:endoplasmic reticulum lectin 1 isoform X2 n=1 Tax=Chelonus insularis TaxID=460826 RepID=UPI001589CB90|nr:endoplasmic reticulum lectin 1 isoform X2 [Chelonus insularis]